MMFRTINSGFLVLLLLVMLPTALFSQDANEAGHDPGKLAEQKPQAVKLPELKLELESRVARDQEARMAMIEAMKLPKSVESGKHGDDPKVDWRERVVVIDRENREWLAAQVEEHGWPGKTLVGETGAHHAWMLVQHADRDLAFQLRCLELMNAMPKGEVAPVDIAYLTDRVLSAQGKPQRYGTQCTLVDGKAVVKSVEDSENLNRRRAELGLDPIEDYLKLVEKMYAAPKQNADSDK